MSILALLFKIQKFILDLEVLKMSIKLSETRINVLIASHHVWLETIGIVIEFWFRTCLSITAIRFSVSLCNKGAYWLKQLFRSWICTLQSKHLYAAKITKALSLWSVWAICRLSPWSRPRLLPISAGLKRPKECILIWTEGESRRYRQPEVFRHSWSVCTNEESTVV